MSDGEAALLRDCMWAWWELKYQDYRINQEGQVMAISRELSIYRLMDRPWLYRR